MRSTLFCLLLGLTCSAAQAAGDVDRVARLVQQDFARCGQTITLSTPLNLAAQQQFRGFTLEQVLKQQQYRPHQALGTTITYNGDLNSLTQALSGHCADRLGYTQVGVSTNTRVLHLIAATPARVDPAQTPRWLGEFLAATNRARFQGQKCGGVLMNAVPPLRWDERLAGAAAQHAGDMVQLNFRGHVNPLDGSRAQQRAERRGFQGRAGENIQYGAITPQEAIEHLLASPEHCRNLMDPHWTLFGAAVQNGTATSIFPTYWVQVFGREN